MADWPSPSSARPYIQMYILLTVLIVVSQTTAQGINLALGKPVTVSSTEFYIYNWNESLAVDGTVPVGTQSTDDCRCCSSTQRKVDNWLTVDLGEIYTISSINVQGRTDGDNGRLRGIRLYIRNTTGDTEQQVFTQQVNRQNFTWSSTTGTLTRLVTLRKPNKDFLIVCEIRVFKRDCDRGKYGSVCSHDCSNNCAGLTCDQTSGHCDRCDPGKHGDMCTEICPKHCDDDVCYQTDGLCTTGCKEGYQGQRCESECDDGWYGTNCVSQCGNCMDVSRCNKQNGTCMTGCRPGYTPGLCKDACNHGTYGYHCTGTCGQCLSTWECNTQNGTCMTGCLPGFKPGFCTDECDDGRYGVNCGYSCGNCADMTSCNKKNGTCLTGCTAGYQPELCEQPCTYQTFGVNCQERCHCYQGNQCGAVNGLCPDGRCEIGYGLSNCSKDVSLLPSLNGNFTVNQSSIYGDLGPERAVDGDIRRDPDVCYCCSSTRSIKSENSWWTIDLWQQYLIEYIQVYSRSGNRKQIQGFQTYISNSTAGTALGIYNDSSGPVKPNYTIRVDPVQPVQVVKIVKAPGMLTLCEVKIIEKVCEIESYGYNCGRKCHCGDQMRCHGISGHCKSVLCLPGWKGLACNQECEEGTFGTNCLSTCRCTDDSQCSQSDGQCGGNPCLPGWQGPSCQKACEDGTYGQNCSFTCGNCVTNTCTKHNGTCTRGCSEEFTGVFCTQAVVQDPTSSGPIIGAVVGSVVAVLIIGVVIAIVLVRRKRQRPKQTEQFSQAARAEENAAFDGDLSKDNPEEPNENMYDNWNQQPLIPKGILMHQLYDYIKKNLVEKAAGFNIEYNKLRNGLEASHSAALIEKNRGKNRYKNMVAYDHSRVLLVDRPEEMSDYINACYINGFERVKKFIASQGPTDAMVEDFWHMVWQEKSNQIVMVTNLVELGAVKCIQYWPDKDRVVYGELTITIINTQTFADYCIRTLEISKGRSTSRQVDQFHFQAWPDKNVPDSAWSLVNFWREVSRQKSDKSCPTVVHCSAGVGRTGTYIALDCLYNQAQKEGCVDVLSCVETLRRQRVNMVQTSTQYVYLHEAVAEALCIGTLPLLTSHFKQWYTEMLKEDTFSNRSRLQMQHELYTLSMGETDTSKSQGKRMSQSLKDSMPHFIKNCMGKKAFIIMTTPTSGTSGDLKHTIEAHNVTTVVNLSNTRTRPADQKSNKAVQYFDLTSWEEYGVPKTPSDVPSVVEQIQDWQPHLTESKPILLYSNSADRCGMLYIILNELHRINMDGLVSVLQAATSMTSEEDSFNVTLNWMQYKFCHDVLLDHIQQANVYQNT